jgi:hypothetical protein
MPRKQNKQTSARPRRRPEPIPPGATQAAADRPLNPDEGLPESGAGPRHASDDPGSPNESIEATDSNQPLAESPLSDEPDALESGPPYAGVSGGAVGGTPAEGRSSGGHVDHGIAGDGVHRGDSTIGSPDPVGRRSQRKRKEQKG